MVYSEIATRCLHMVFYPFATRCIMVVCFFRRGSLNSAGLLVVIGTHDDAGFQRLRGPLVHFGFIVI